MRSIVALFIALTFAPGAGVVGTLAAEKKCMIGDSALCLAEPDCYWDSQTRGCYPGQAEHKDACSVHTDQTICDLDITLGCKWSASANTCETKAE